jgi:hypothetical protein
MRQQAFQFFSSVWLCAGVLWCEPTRAAEPNPPATAPAANVNVTRVYDVRDLIVSVPDFDDEPDFSPQPIPDGAPLPNGAVDLFGNPPGIAPPRGPSRQEIIEQLTTCLKTSVTPDVWKNTATIRELQGQLIISATPATHRQVTSFLENARRRYDTQVTLTVRILDLRKLEKLAGLHADLLKKLRIAVSPFGPRTGLELTTDEVRQIDDATRPTVDGVRTHPRVTLFNGQRAYVLVTTQRAFISGYKAQPAGNGFDPQMKIAESGTLLALQAGVSEDRKQVAVNLLVKLSELRGMGKAPFVGAPAEKGLMIDVPDVRVRALRTTISLGDQRTLALGGFRDVSKELGWNPPAPRPAAVVNAPVRDKEQTAGLDEELIVLVKPTVIVERPPAGKKD